MLLHTCACVCVYVCVCVSQGILRPWVTDWDSHGTVTLVLRTGRGDQGVLFSVSSSSGVMQRKPSSSIGRGGMIYAKSL